MRASQHDAATPARLPKRVDPLIASQAGPPVNTLDDEMEVEEEEGTPQYHVMKLRGKNRYKFALKQPQPVAPVQPVAVLPVHAPHPAPSWWAPTENPGAAASPLHLSDGCRSQYKGYPPYRSHLYDNYDPYAIESYASYKEYCSDAAHSE